MKYQDFLSDEISYAVKIQFLTIFHLWRCRGCHDYFISANRKLPLQQRTLFHKLFTRFKKLSRRLFYEI